MYEKSHAAHNHIRASGEGSALSHPRAWVRAPGLGTVLPALVSSARCVVVCVCVCMHV